MIAPDTRGSRKSYIPAARSATLLADDVAALIGALGLDRPMVCGFSDGGEARPWWACASPGSVRASSTRGI